MNTKPTQFLKYYIRVADVALFNILVASAEEDSPTVFEARRTALGYELRTNDELLWHDLYLYGQMVAQAQGKLIEGGQD